MDIPIQKKNLREKMISRRAKLPNLFKQKYDNWVCESLLKRILKKNLKVIHCFLPIEHEINIFPLIEILLKKEITVVTPKTLTKRQLEHLVLKDLKELDVGKFGTVHPNSNIVYKGNYDLIIIPGLAFDENKNRLGYGGGYYDNFISNHPLALKTGICYPFQKVDKIPVESHDVILNDILVKMEASQFL